VHTAPIAAGGLAATAAIEPARGISQVVACIAARARLLRLVGAAHAFLYRWSAGRLGGSVCGRPVLLLSTRGRKTGLPRTIPVCFLAADGGLVLAAAAAGRRRHPAWYLNLRANPRVEVQLGAHRRSMTARIPGDFERARLWARICRQYPVCTRYQQRSRRTIPVVVLTPADEGPTP
jgi:deazaflavin-dependent oxidoreductase (nitroreductase family)